MARTVIFEEKYDVDIREFSTTNDVDAFLEQKLGRELKVISCCGMPVVNYKDIYEEINKALDRLKVRRKM